MSDEVITKAEILSLVVRVAALSAISYYTVKWLMDAMDPTRKQKLVAQEKAKQLMKEIGITAADGNLKLNEYEMMIASSLVDGRSISTSWKDIAGLEGSHHHAETILVYLKQFCLKKSCGAAVFDKLRESSFQPSLEFFD